MANRRYRPHGIQRSSFHKWAASNNVTIFRDKDGNVIRTVKTKDVNKNNGDVNNSRKLVDLVVSLGL